MLGHSRTRANEDNHKELYQKFNMIRIMQNKLFGDIKICARPKEEGYIPSEEELTTN